MTFTIFLVFFFLCVLQLKTKLRRGVQGRRRAMVTVRRTLSRWHNYYNIKYIMHAMTIPVFAFATADWVLLVFAYWHPWVLHLRPKTRVYNYFVRCNQPGLVRDSVVNGLSDFSKSTRAAMKFVSILYKRDYAGVALASPVYFLDYY